LPEEAVQEPAEVPDRVLGREPAEVLREHRVPAEAVRVPAGETDCFRNPYLISPFNNKTKKKLSFEDKLAHYFNKIN
jgi:hypothetical protein